MGAQSALDRHRKRHGGMSSPNERSRRHAFVLRNIFRGIRRDRAWTPTFKIKKTRRADTNRREEDPISNHSFHSDRTANTSTSGSSLDGTSSGTRKASSTVSEYIPRCPYPKPAWTAGRPSDQKPSSDAGAPTPVSSSGKGAPDEITQTANERPQTPRRSSDKKTSNCKIKPSAPPSAILAQEAEIPQRRWSTTGISSTTRPGSEKTTGQPNSPRRRRSVQFKKEVSFAIVATAVDILDEDEEGEGATDLFYTEKDFLRMKQNAKRDAQKMITKENPTEKTSCNASTTANIRTMDQNGNNDNEQNFHKEEDLCDWGIEFHTSSLDGRLDRSLRVKAVIQTVLQEQDSQCSIDPSTGMLTEASVQSLAKASARASQNARLQAQRRGNEAEMCCRRWSCSDFGSVDASAPTTCTTDNDKGGVEIRRHSSCECAPKNSDRRRKEFDDVVTIHEENDACDGEVLSVADASLDETTPRVRPQLRRRASSCST